MLQTLKLLFVSFIMIGIIAVAPARSANVYGNKYASIIIDQKTSQVLYSRGAKLKRYPASLTKIMTLYILFDELKAGRISMSTRFKASRRATRQPPSKIGLGVGERITVKNAILALVTKSANDVAVTVAENVRGSERKFARYMTARARQMGMHDTVFKNASGLPNYAQTTTAYDMAILGARVFKDFPEYYPLFKTKSFKYAGIRHRNHNGLLKRYKGTDGIKTGYIRASGFNLVASVKRDNTRLIGVVFGGVSGSRRDLHMMYLLNKGFRTVTHLKQRPLDKTLTKSYALLHDKKVPVQVAKVHVKKHVKNVIVKEQGSKTPVMKSWAVQLGAYRNKSVAKNVAKRVIAIIPDTADANIEIIEMKKMKKSLYRSRITGLAKVKAKSICTTVLAETPLSCILLQE